MAAPNAPKTAAQSQHHWHLDGPHHHRHSLHDAHYYAGVGARAAAAAAESAADSSDSDADAAMVQAYDALEAVRQASDQLSTFSVCVCVVKV